MDVYNVPQQGHADAYMIQGTEPNQHLTSLMPEQFQAMYSEGNPEFVVDQGMLYPTAASYGYYCTGYEPPIESDDHHRVFGLDGQDMQYVGPQADSLQYVYYTPNYGYTQSPYNPYNPYIPGAMFGLDGSFLGSQQYYNHPAYDGASSAYVPAVIQSGSGNPNSSDSSVPTVNRGDGFGLKHNMSSASKTFNPTPIRRSSEGNRSSVGTTKQPSMRGGAQSAQSAQNVTQGKAFSNCDQLRASLSFGSSSISSNLIYKGITDDQKARPDVLVEHNKHLRAHNSRRQLVVKAYTRKAGTVDEQGNITIDTDQYNRDDFVLDFQNAKFFVIKSYSEDDVHKSIKYSVWSSTPNGNRKLQGAYDDAQRIAAGGIRCPIFLFFSVNASGQFCGVAEMTGPVDFSKDMDFWQQDKWSGSFPVKWHIIKDAPNPTFRHIILETNENKPVTNSRDTQEIPFKKGFEMLKIYKSHASRTSLFDDFMYYENRQRILQEERARFLIKNYGTSYIVPTVGPPQKITLPDMPSEKGDNDNESTKPEAQEIASVDSLRIDSLAIGAKKSQGEKIGSLAATTITTTNAPPLSTSSPDVVTVGSMPIKVNGSAKLSGILTIGEIPLDPRALTNNEFKNDINKG